ncbi:MAG: hypothetical protein DMF64_01260 [Acidobacteria bacterium]|nr:MAG: hypothetical protein DMF64_01260 [Acidobacteriota bacterium]
MQELRESGVYTLPGVGDLVVHTIFRGGYFLYTPEAWEFNGLHRYESGADGRMRLNGRPTEWQINQLTDTGRTARSRSRSGAAQQAFIG